MSKKAPMPMWKKILWRGIVFPVLAVAVLGFGVMLFAGGEVTKSAAPQNIIVIDSAAKAKDAMAKMQASAKAGKPVFMEVCDGEFCAEQLAELDKVAAEYKDKVLFVTVKPSMIAPMLPKIQQVLDGPLAFPLHVIDTGKIPVAMSGMLDHDQLKQLVEAALKISSGEFKLPSQAPAPNADAGNNAVAPKADVSKDSGTSDATTSGATVVAPNKADNNPATTQPSGK
jgi:hypothetical protein